MPRDRRLTDFVDADSGVRTSFCRICFNGCPILVELDGAGLAVSVTGDHLSDSPHAGFTCNKGRAQPAFLRHADRLLHSLKRQPDGSFERIPIGQAVEEIAECLTTIKAKHGSRAIASYWGTMAVRSALTTPILEAFMTGVGSPMRFNPNTIDKPGKGIARALHGSWQAPAQGFDRPDVAVLVGINPLVSFQGMPTGNPGKWLRASLDRGMQLIVIDPRRTEIARRAHLHLQPRPGFDAAILASFLHVILGEDLHDRSFVDEHTKGVAELDDAVAGFTPERVAGLADVPAADLVAAARTYATAGRGYVIAGTGPSMSGYGTLVEYLVLNLLSVCGRWQRAGEVVRNPGTLKAPRAAVARPTPPQPTSGFGESLRVRGLAESVAGMPTCGLADEVLLPGDGQVRALLSCGGNPVAAWPDQDHTIEAMRHLELLVQIDPWMSQTAHYAHYVIAPTMPLEVEDVTLIPDTMQQPHVGTVDPWSQHSPPVVRRPAGSDLIEEWQFFFRLAAAMHVPLTVDRQSIGSIEPFTLEMGREPTSRDLLEMLTRGARVPLSEVERHPHGIRVTDPPEVVQEGTPDTGARLDLAAPTMLAQLVAFLRAEEAPSTATDNFPFRLLCRRTPIAYNSSCIDVSTHKDRPYNPAFMHPDDLDTLGLVAGDLVEITSTHGSARAIVRDDAHLRQGTVSITHCYGGVENEDAPLSTGTNTNRLISVLDLADPLSGQPRMSDLPVRVEPVA